MATINLILVGFLVSFAFTTWSLVSGKLLATTEDVVVVRGETVQLNCSTDDTYGVNWWHVPVGSTTNEDVFISRVVVLPYYPRFKVERKEVENNIQDYNLIITSVRREDAGKYTCIDRVGHGEQRHAQLVVLEHRPHCNTNIDQEGFGGDNACGITHDEIRCSCSLQYSGNNPPAMEWTNSAGQMIEHQSPVNTSQENSISSNLVMKPSLAMSGTAIVWRSELLNSNNWTSPQVKVKYVIESPIQIDIDESTQLTCTANSTASCSYKWIDENGNVTSTNRTVGIDVPGMYRCEADCLIQGQICTVQCLEVTYVQIQACYASNFPLIAIIIVSVGLLVVFLLVTVIVIAVWCKRRRNVTKQLQMQNDTSEKEKMLVKLMISDASLRTAY